MTLTIDMTRRVGRGDHGKPAVRPVTMKKTNASITTLADQTIAAPMAPNLAAIIAATIR